MIIPPDISVELPPDRHGDDRWNQCLDTLIRAWNEVGPDITLATLRWVCGDPPGDAEDATTGTGGAALWPIPRRPRFGSP